MFCCRATSWDSGVCLTCYTMLYIYVAGLIEAGFLLPPGLCVGYSKGDNGAVQGLLVHVVCYVYGCSVLCLFSGGGSTILWWVGVFLMFLLFLGVASL